MKTKIIIFLILVTPLFLTACLPSKPSLPSSPSPTAQTQIPTKTFTLEELAQYNGKNGQPAYLAVDSLVYDLSSVFKEGTHYQHLAGKELTADFYSAHVKSDLQNYPVVGRLKE
jgi:predicted heme/steroid binding protein